MARARALERAGATIIAVDGPDIADGLRHLPELGIQSLILEGGAEVHASAWDEGVVDYVQLYVGPDVIGPAGVPLLAGRGFSTASLIESRTTPLGPDVVIEGYVHRPH
jgi:diaminohydroxyphosphoribosylaminopyrimidine deaminase/5-amino-6-(5-phosphoribosylamino)uracil reductase